MADRDRTQLLRKPLPSLGDAKRAAAVGKATIEDELVLLSHFQDIQQWDRALLTCKTPKSSPASPA